VRARPALVVLFLPALAGAQPASTAPPEQLGACATITDSAARLACYDKLAGRGAAATAPAAPAAQASPPPAAAPAAAAGSASAPAAPAAPAAAAAAPVPAPAAAPPASPKSFGLYEAEHPKPPPVSRTLTSRVVSVSQSAGGPMTVTLEGGASWQLLDDGDVLLTAGDTVTITRAAFGSYLMSTPTKRTHRVRRLD
jgi:hypothetical protein